MSELVSIVMPVYNTEKYIRKAVKSVIDQTYINFELIIVNDGTKDKSIERISDLVKQDKRIKVINRENGGLSAARNTGMKYCNGKYLIFMDSDDTIDKCLVEDAVKCAEKNGSDIVVHGYSVIHADINDNILNKTDITLKKLSFSDIVIEKTMLANYFNAVAFACSKLYKLDYILKNKFVFEEGTSLIEDILFNVSVFMGTDKINFIPEAYYNYWIRKRETLSSMFYKNNFELFKRGFKCREDLIGYLFRSADNVSELMADNYLIGIRGCCTNLFLYDNNLTNSDKRNRIKEFLNDEMTSKYVTKYRGKDMFSRLICISARYHGSILIYSLYRIKYILKEKLKR